MKIPCYKLSPELGDGYSPTLIPSNAPDARSLVLDAVKTWLEEDPPGGEHCQIELVEMTQTQLDALPEL